MALEYRTFTLGPLSNNTYLIFDTRIREAAIIDPSFDTQPILDILKTLNLALRSIWLTHAHFDHIAGVPSLAQTFPEAQIGLHPADLPLWQEKGGASWFGWSLELSCTPNFTLKHEQRLGLGNHEIEVRHTPGHTPGHVVFYLPESKVLFCGDLIFHRSIGRTDLPGGDFEQLVHSIRTQVYTLPAETRLLPGHGLESTVGEEQENNPWVRF